MTQTNPSTPLWLKLKTQYIDDNFEALLPYLKKNVNREDDFLQTTINLLAQRAAEIIEEIATRPIYIDEQQPLEEQRRRNVRILSAYLLACPDDAQRRTAYIAMLSELKMLEPKYTDSLTAKIAESLRHRFIYRIGISWDDIADFQPQIFANKVKDYTELSTPLSDPLTLSGQGTCIVTDKGLSVMAERGDKARPLFTSFSESLITGLSISLRTTSDDKLKQSLCHDIDAMHTFILDFTERQKTAPAEPKKKHLRTYSVDDEAIVRITQIDGDGTIHVVTVDEGFQPMEGTIVFKRQSLMYYYTDILYKDFKVGDCLPATVLSPAKRQFIIEKQLIEFMVEDCRSQNGTTKDILCKLIDVKPHQCGWLTDWGIALYSRNDGTFTEKTDDTFALLQVTRYGDGTYYGKIDAQIIEAYTDENFDEQQVRHECIRAFAEQTTPPAPKSTAVDGHPLDPHILQILIRVLFTSQKTLFRPVEKFRYLANAWAMAVLLGDTQAESYLHFTATYLRQLVMFVRDGKTDSTRLTPDATFADEPNVRTRMAVIQLLAEYGKTDYSPELAHIIEQSTADGNTMLATLGRLIQTANTMKGVFSRSTHNIIRREIISTLSLETEDEADLESENKAYLGVESQTVEFKESFVYPAGNNMQPEPRRQMHNVCRGICGFLNSETGGTLYLGVNDQGYVCGLANDMNYLHTITIDSYMRYVQDNAQHCLGLDSMAYIHIEPLHDNNVVAIHVTPHPYRVVELDGKAYLRVNAESREMPETMRLELIDRKMLHDKEKAAAISKLQHAAECRKIVILHGYSSSNSLSVSDRKVEAYTVLPTEGLVFCFDYKDYKCKVFNINRIGYVEMTDADWQHPFAHEDIKVDAFHFSGTRPIRVSLRLDLMAKNLLVEEFPRTKDDVTADANDPSLWYLTIDVYSIYGIGRFYTGLAGHITILDCPELKAYVEEYKQLL